MKKFLKRDLVKSIIAVGLMIFVVLSFTGCVHVAQGVLSGVVSIFQATPTPSARPQPIQQDGKVFLVTKEQLKDRINQEIASKGMKIGDLEKEENSGYFANKFVVQDNVIFGANVDDTGNVSGFILGGLTDLNPDMDFLFEVIFRVLYDEEKADTMRQQFQNRLGEKQFGKQINVVYQGLCIILSYDGKSWLYSVMPIPETEADRTWTVDMEKSE